MSILNEPTLVLNRNWQPVAFLPVRTAIVTVMRDMATVLDPESYRLMGMEDWVGHEPVAARWIKTAGVPIAVPEVIVLKKYGERPPFRINLTRPNLYRRDDYECQYCGENLPGKKLTVEHVIPKSRGGPMAWDNVVAACKRCNQDKADRTPKEAGMKLRKQPHKPDWKRKLQPPQGILRPSWAVFLEKERSA